MAQPFLKPVKDSVPKIAGDVAVGEDLNFQRRWWRFERGVWIFFLVALVCDVLGVFGHGWLSKASRSTPDRSLAISYERIERANTPSIMTLHFSPAAVHDGRVQIFVSNDVVQRLGARRISPQPSSSVLSDGGFTYTFPAESAPASVEISLQPSFPGTQHIRVQIPGEPPIDAGVFVFP